MRPHSERRPVQLPINLESLVVLLLKEIAQVERLRRGRGIAVSDHLEVDGDPEATAREQNRHGDGGEDGGRFHSALSLGKELRSWRSRRSGQLLEADELAKKAPPEPDPSFFQR